MPPKPKLKEQNLETLVVEDLTPLTPEAKKLLIPELWNLQPKVLPII